MKILHFADLHIGYENYGHLDEKTGLNSRLLDFLKGFDQIVDYALKHQIELIVFAGDAYKTRDPNPTCQREFGKRVKKIASQIPIVLITGNHDIPPSFGKADTLEIFPTLEVPNVYVYSQPTQAIIKTKNGPVQILALPWLARSRLLQEKERRYPIEKVRDILSQRLSEIFTKLLHQLKPNLPTIAVIHQSVTGASFASNQTTYLGNDPLLPLSLLTNPTLNYVALGHLHKYQVLSEKPPVIYPGSIERIDFGEEGETKGFVVAEIKPKKTDWEFIELPARPFRTINIEIPPGTPSPSEYLKEKLSPVEIKGAIIRLIILGKEADLKQISGAELKKLLSEAAYVASIIKKSEKTIKKIEPAEPGLKPAEWLKRYLKLKNFDPKIREELIKEGLRLIEEVGL